MAENTLIAFSSEIPMGAGLPAVTIRPFRWDDLEAITALANRVLADDQPDRHLTLDQVRHDYEEPDFAPEQNVFVVVTLDGQIIADVGVQIIDAAKGRGWSGGHVHPDYRRHGLGRQLIQLSESHFLDRAKTGIAPDKPLFIQRMSLDTNTGAIRLFESEGYRPARYFYQMRIALDTPIEPPTFPEGITLRPFVQERDLQAVYQADMDAFAEHWGFVQFTLEEWIHQFISNPNYDPSMWLIAWAGSEVAGICLNNPWGDGKEGIGYVADLGVLKPYRCHGLGYALLRESFRLFRQRGYTTGSLHVDSSNATNAVGLYERAGMHVYQRTISFRKILRGTETDID